METEPKAELPPPGTKVMTSVIAPLCEEIAVIVKGTFGIEPKIKVLPQKKGDHEYTCAIAL